MRHGQGSLRPHRSAAPRISLAAALQGQFNSASRPARSPHEGGPHPHVPVPRRFGPGPRHGSRRRADDQAGRTAADRADEQLGRPARSGAEAGALPERRPQDRSAARQPVDQGRGHAALRGHRADPDAGDRPRSQSAGQRDRDRRQAAEAGSVEQSRGPDDHPARQDGARRRHGDRGDHLWRHAARRGAGALGRRIRLGEDAAGPALGGNRGADGRLRPVLAVHRLSHLRTRFHRPAHHRAQGVEGDLQRRAQGHRHARRRPLDLELARHQPDALRHRAQCRTL